VEPIFWADRIAREVVERERKLARGIKEYLVECGIGASGIPHIGSIGDSLRAYAVRLALQNLGVKSRLIAFSDDRDGLRKVPLGLPEQLKKYIGYPVSKIPDPFNCHPSYGAHMSYLLLEALEKLGVEYEFRSGDESYSKGLLDEEIHTILKNSSKVGEIIRRVTGQVKFEEVLPFFAICEECGRIYTTRACDYLEKERKVLYKCDREFEGRGASGEEIRVEGCGHEGEAGIRDGKLGWKAEFAARWRALRIVFEPYGKDIADSVKVNDLVCKEILKFEPPLHLMYELFLQRGGRKISKSIGNVFTPQVWLRYGSPQSLNLLMLKLFKRTRIIDVDVIPRYMDELLRLQRVYFGIEEVKNERRRRHLQRVFEYAHFLKPPAKALPLVPYQVLLNLVEPIKELSAQEKLKIVVQTLQRTSYLKEIGKKEEKILREQIGYAINWLAEYGLIEKVEIELSKEEREALEEFSRAIDESLDEEQIQAKIFEVARRKGVRPASFFKLLYKIILKSEFGPRAGFLIKSIGVKKVRRMIRAL
jgi:lysyl-tRNA synthetase class 1